MHIPVLLAGLICGPFFGLVVGIVGPLFSSLITSMPPVGVLPIMMIELATYGLVSGLIIKLVRTRRLSLDLYISLILAMLAGRIAAGIAQVFYFFDGVYLIGMWVASYFTTSVPGLVVQLLLIPALVIALERERVIPIRYPRSVINNEPVANNGYGS